MDYVRLRFDVTLATETFSGSYHERGAEQLGYRLAIPMGIYQDRSGNISWAQEPDKKGHMDPRMPESGAATLQDGDLLLTHWAGSANIFESVAILQGFTPSTSQGKGVAFCTYMQRRTYAPANPANPASRTDWKGRGSWEVLERRFASSPNNSSASGWSFVTAGGAGGGVLLAASGGKFILSDPHGREWQFFYGGIGVGAGWKKANIKGVSASGGPTAFPNAGAVMKSPLWVGTRELLADDMTGRCVWIDGAAVGVLGVGGALMFLGLHDFAFPLMGPGAANAFVPSIGITGGLALGGGVYFGNVWGAW